MDIYSNEEASFNEVSKIGLVIGYIPKDPSQRHVGFLLKTSEDAKAKSLDLMFGEIGFNKPRANMAWANISLDPITKKILQAKCIAISKRKGSSVPYAFTYDGDYFSSEGEYTRNGNNDGLTCATFILAVFRSIGIELVSLTEWPDREADTEWQKKMVPILVESLKLPDESLLSQLGNIRVRPEEATAAACEQTHPVTFALVEEQSKVLLEKLFGLFPHSSYNHRAEFDPI